MRKLNKNEKGFTIIEVLIVLAIAGLIMVIVFLAVPALQRNSRNTQRNADASRIAGAVNECIAAHNGVIATCTNSAAADLNGYITVANNSQLTGQGAAGLNTFAITTGQQCNATGTGSAGGGGTRSFVVTYNIETTAGGAGQLRCVGS